MIARSPTRFFQPHFWAEDGSVFFRDAHELGASSLATPYSGYLHAYPRAVAYLASFAPLAWTPTLYMLGGLASTLWVSLFLFHPRLPLSYKPALALVPALIPHNGECFLTITNAQWYLALTLILLPLLTPPSRPIHALPEFLLLVVLGLTGPFVLLALPLFLVRADRERTWYPLTMAAIAIGIAVFHSLFVYMQGAPNSICNALPETWKEIAEAGRVSCWRMSLCLGELRYASLPKKWWIPIAALMPLVLLGLTRREPTSFKLAWGGLFLGVLNIVSGVARNKSHVMCLVEDEIRYEVIYAVAIGWAIVAAWPLCRWGRLALAACAAVFLASIPFGFTSKVPTDSSPWPEVVARLERGERVEFHFPPGWQTTVGPLGPLADSRTIAVPTAGELP